MIPILNPKIEHNIGPNSEPNIEPNIEPEIECNIGSKSFFYQTFFDLDFFDQTLFGTNAGRIHWSEFSEMVRIRTKCQNVVRKKSEFG